MNFSSNVTVIIPCYNDGKFIMEAINSIFNQTLKAEKIIIIDDGSGQETKNILKTINHKNVEIIFQENKGVCEARNRGINLAETDYILTLDADDYFETTFIEKSVEILNNNLNIGVVGCYYRVLKGNTKEKEIIKPLGGKAKDFLIKNNGLASSMFRKKCWQQVSGYDEKMANGYEDWEFWINILSLNWLMHIIEEPLFVYRQKPISRDQTAIKEYDFELRAYIFAKHREIYKEHFDFYATELIRKNSILGSNVNKIKKSTNYKIGTLFLIPIRFLKTRVNFKK